LDLPTEVVGLIDSKALSMGHARALLGLEDEGERLRVGRVVAVRGYSVRETENLVRKAGQARAAGGVGATVRVAKPELSVVSEVMKTAAVRVQLQQKASGAARIVVDVVDGKARDAVIAALRGALE
jgi:ParB family chromosome partitioning protein